MTVWGRSEDCACPFKYCAETTDENQPPDPCSYGHRPTAIEPNAGDNPPSGQEVGITIGVDSSQLEAAKAITEAILADLVEAEAAMVRMGVSSIRPMLAQFAVQMEGRMKVGDQRGWVWDDQARQTASPVNIEGRILGNLSAGLAALEAGDTVKAQECFTDVSNLSMLLADLAAQNG